MATKRTRVPLDPAHSLFAGGMDAFVRERYRRYKWVCLAVAGLVNVSLGAVGRPITPLRRASTWTVEHHRWRLLGLIQLFLTDAWLVVSDALTPSHDAAQVRAQHGQEDLNPIRAISEVSLKNPSQSVCTSRLSIQL